MSDLGESDSGSLGTVIVCPPADSSNIDSCVRRYLEDYSKFRIWNRTVLSVIEENSVLSSGHSPLLHTIKSRLKDPEHLRDKLTRKIAEGRVVNVSNMYSEIIDLVGIRFLHLNQKDAEGIHKELMAQVTNYEWYLEEVKAYTWDPEINEFFSNIGVPSEVKASQYTSVHYVVRPRRDAEVACEIQVRTLFEEVWGEIDHMLNYPYPTQNLACSEQLKVLAKLVATGTRLVSAILTTHENYRRSCKTN